MNMFASRTIYASALMLIIWIQEVSAEGALSIFHKQCKGDTDVFNFHYASLSCYGECTWGGRGTFTATYTLGKNLTSSIAEVGLSVLSVPGWNGTVDMCNWGQTFSNSATCPEIGTYTEYISVTLPGKQDSIYSKYMLWMSVSVYAAIDFSDDDYSVVCEFKVNGKYARVSQMTATSAILLLGVGFFRSRKKRRIATADEIDTTTQFVEMGNMDVSNEIRRSERSVV